MTHKIGIIGVGPIGSALATAWVKAGHSVKIANSRGPETLKEKEKVTGATAVKIEEAVKNVDVVVVSIPFKAIPQLPKTLFSDSPKDLVIIDTCNYYPEIRDDRVEELDNFTLTDSEWVSKQLGRPIIKVYNSITDFSLRELAVPAGTKGRIALAVSGDNAKAKEVVIGLVNDSGFDGYDLGTLADSWRQQPGSPIYCTDLTVDQIPVALKHLGAREKLAELRGVSVQKVMQNIHSSSEVKRKVIREALYPAYFTQ